MWYFFLIGPGILLLGCSLLQGAYVGGGPNEYDDLLPQRRGSGSFRLIIEGENGKIYKSVMKVRYEDEETVAFRYADDSSLCVVLPDKEAEPYLKQHELLKTGF